MIDASWSFALLVCAALVVPGGAILLHSWLHRRRADRRMAERLQRFTAPRMDDWGWGA